MPQIRILPEILANKIAAGEVVERPASVVKELVENALDAQGDRILVEIENGGRSLIQVADNGLGMHPDDALLSLERFATSKIRSDNDLFAIHTLGFRGEALPSVAAVSKMVLVTRHRQSHQGVEVRLEGGKILHVNEVGAPTGTMIRVAQLFYNTPARRKFLKTIGTEMAHIGDTVAGMALAYPQVQFKLIHNGKPVKQWPRVGDPAERAADVLGQAGRQELVPLELDDGYLNISGYLVPAQVSRTTTRGIYLYVNGRRVRDRVVQHALFEGFSGRLMKGQFPLAALFIRLAFDQVDVNVHPTKHEIRFADQRRVHNSVRDLVAAALSRAERKLWRTDAIDQPVAGPAVGEPRAPYSAAPDGDPSPAALEGGRRLPLQSRPEVEVRYVSQSPAGAEDQTGRAKPERDHALLPPGDTAQTTFWSTKPFADLDVIGQFAGTYIICQAQGELILIDQHAAHERIVYEQLQRSAGRLESQRLLLPQTVELGFAEARMLESLLPRLHDMGLEIEPFGGTTFVVKAVPTLLDDQDAERLVVELAEKGVEVGLETGLDKVLDQCRMVMACHHAVRANQRLNDTQIRHMLAQLDLCQDPSHCPHGRPTWIRWTRRELEKAFGRTR